MNSLAKGRFYLYVSVFPVLLMIASCRSGKDLSAPKPVRIEKSDASRLYDDLINGDNYTWYTGKARIKAQTPDARMSAAVNLRMLRDSAIWITIEKLGFEIARVFITPDSVFAVDRLNKEYTQTTLAGFLTEYGVHVGFRDLQNALIGKMIALTPLHLESKPDSDLYALIVRDGSGVTATHWVTSTSPQRLMKSFLVDASGRKLQIENMQWETIHDGSQVPYGRLLSFEDQDGLTQIQIEFSEIKKNVPATLPFHIPENYTLAR